MTAYIILTLSILLLFCGTSSLSAQTITISTPSSTAYNRISMINGGIGDDFFPCGWAKNRSMNVLDVAPTQQWKITVQKIVINWPSSSNWMSRRESDGAGTGPAPTGGVSWTPFDTTPTDFFFGTGVRTNIIFSTMFCGRSVAMEPTPSGFQYQANIVYTLVLQ